MFGLIYKVGIIGVSYSLMCHCHPSTTWKPIMYLFIYLFIYFTPPASNAKMTRFGWLYCRRVHLVSLKHLLRSSWACDLRQWAWIKVTALAEIACFHPLDMGQRTLDNRELAHSKNWKFFFYCLHQKGNCGEMWAQMKTKIYGWFTCKQHWSADKISGFTLRASIKDGLFCQKCKNSI